MRVVELPILRWMNGHTLKYKFQNKDIRICVHVTYIEDKMSENDVSGLGMCNDEVLVS